MSSDPTRAQLHTELHNVLAAQESTKTLMMPLGHIPGHRVQKVITTIEKRERVRDHYPIDPMMERILLLGVGGALVLLILAAAVALILWAL